MPDSRVRVLVINPKLPIAVGIKTAFDALGGFDARPFTSPLNALEFARTAPPDAAVLDLMIRSPGIAETTVALRKLNPKIKLLLTNAPDEAVTKLRADGLLSLPPRAREIEPMLRALFPPDAESRPGTPSRRPLELRTSAARDSARDTPTLASRDNAPTKPAREETPTLPARDNVQDKLPDALEQDDPFDRIAGEEPPVPTGMEGGTVREAVRAMLPRQPLDESMYVVEITPRPSDTDEDKPIPGSGEWRALTPAEAAEEERAEEAAADEAESESDAVSEITPDDDAPEAPIAADGEAVKAAPETSQTPPKPAEPVDLSERLAVDEPEVPKNETAAPTKRNDGIKVPALPPVRPILPTDKMPRVQPPKPFETLKPLEQPRPIAPLEPVEPLNPPVAHAFDDSDADLDEPPTDSRAAAKPLAGTPPVIPAQPTPAQAQTDAPPVVIPGVRRPAKKPDDEPASEAQEVPPVAIPGQRRAPKKQEAEPAAGPQPEAHETSAPRRALTPGELRKALRLTHEQIGTTAAALILTDGSDILAHSGEMPTQEIEQLERVIGGDWEVRGSQARVRYITLPTSRQEYMLHTRRTENGYVLSMAFAGDLAVSEIRAQSDAVAETLHALRPAGGDDPAAALADASLVGLTAVWMLDNPEAPLTADVAQAVVIEFDRQLRDLGWTIHAMNVHTDFVYVYCDVQTTYLASEVIAELKRISAEAAVSRRPDWSPDTLWADAYMVLMPGRELGSDEVESFLAFTRPRLHRKAN